MKDVDEEVLWAELPSSLWVWARLAVQVDGRTCVQVRFWAFMHLPACDYLPFNIVSLTVTEQRLEIGLMFLSSFLDLSHSFEARFYRT